jgi:hypothetical protein
LRLPVFRPQVIPRTSQNQAPSLSRGGNNENLIRQSHASYIAYVNRYNTVYA